MNEDARRLLDSTMERYRTLSQEGRAEFTDGMFDALRREPDADAAGGDGADGGSHPSQPEPDREWAAEIRRRAADARAGGPSESWDDVLAELHEKHRSPSRLTFEISREDDGRWIADVPELPGVMAYGDTRERALAEAHVLALRTLADRIEHGEDAEPDEDGA